MESLNKHGKLSEELMFCLDTERNSLSAGVDSSCPLTQQRLSVPSVLQITVSSLFLISYLLLSWFIKYLNVAQYQV